MKKVNLEFYYYVYVGIYNVDNHKQQY